MTVIAARLPLSMGSLRDDLMRDPHEGRTTVIVIVTENGLRKSRGRWA